jgi:hypothetical protein
MARALGNLFKVPAAPGPLPLAAGAGASLLGPAATSNVTVPLSVTRARRCSDKTPLAPQLEQSAAR